MSYRYIIFFSIILTIFLVLDIYIWKAYRKTVKEKYFKIFKWLIPISSLLFLAGFAINLYRGSLGIYNASLVVNILFGISLGFFIAKIIAAALLLSEDIIRLLLLVKSMAILSRDQTTI